MVAHLAVSVKSGLVTVVLPERSKTAGVEPM